MDSEMRECEPDGGKGRAPRAVSAVRWAIFVVLAAAVCGVTAFPYWHARSHAPEGMMFIGQVANHEDINAAFSFIRQGAKGHALCVNVMTNREQAPVYFNAQFWAMGQVLRWLGWRTHLAFDAWRLIGALLIVTGYGLLERAVLRNGSQRAVARFLCIFGGGLGGYAASLHPFGQVLLNPLVSLPHGLWVAAIACMALGEQRGRGGWYILAACLAALRGICGPHDLVSIAAITAVFVVTEFYFSGRMEWARLGWRVLPLAASAPAGLYYAYLYKTAPDISAWMAAWHPEAGAAREYVAAFGVAGALFVARLALLRRFPLSSPPARFAIIAALAPIGIAYCVPLRGTPFPAGIPSVVPLIAIAATMPNLSGAVRGRRGYVAQWGVAGLCALAGAIPSAALLAQTRAGATEYANYMSKAEFLAFATLNQDTKPEDTVAAPLRMGNLFGQFVDARTVAGHPVLSPDAEELLGTMHAFLRGEMEADEAGAYISEQGIRIIFTEVGDGSAGAEYFETIPGVHVSHDYEGVTLYSVENEEDSGRT